MRPCCECEACGAEVFGDYRHFCLLCGLRLPLTPSSRAPSPSESRSPSPAFRGAMADWFVRQTEARYRRCSRQRSRSPSAASRDLQVLRDLRRKTVIPAGTPLCVLGTLEQHTPAGEQHPFPCAVVRRLSDSESSCNLALVPLNFLVPFRVCELQRSERAPGVDEISRAGAP